MATDCIEWPRARTRAGYGVKWDGSRTRYVHRLAYEEAHGVTLTSHDFVCHSCDNPSCYNIEHLFLGDYQKNSADKVAKNRQAREFNLPHTKLSDEDIVEIISSLERGERNKDIAARFGVHQSHVSKIVARTRRVVREG